MLAVYIEAPFAVCRTFTAGWYRPTATFLTPTAAYGLLLNVAGYESRLTENDPAYPEKSGVPASLTRLGLPACRLAVGMPADGEADFPKVQTLYQQLHNYPVGSSGAERAASTFGNKYNITPVRRELLVNLRAVVCVDGHAELEDRVRRGLNGEWNAGRYGLPFLGDNNFLPDRLEVRADCPPCRWYEQVTAHGDDGPRPRTTRLTTWIDRADLSQTKSALYAPGPEATAEPPPEAWTAIDPPG